MGLVSSPIGVTAYSKSVGLKSGGVVGRNFSFSYKLIVFESPVKIADFYFLFRYQAMMAPTNNKITSTIIMMPTGLEDSSTTAADSVYATLAAAEGDLLSSSKGT